MPKSKRTYTIQDATGTTEELYAWITAGIKNPPSLIAFRSRLKRGERNPAELRRPTNYFSSAGAQARSRGLKADYDRQRTLTGKREESHIPTATTTPQQGYRPPSPTFIRPGSLDAWPELKQAYETQGGKR